MIEQIRPPATERGTRSTGFGALCDAALALIATTRQAWALCEGAAAGAREPGAGRSEFAHPLLRIALDAKSSGMRRTRRMRLRARRRSGGPCFA